LDSFGINFRIDDLDSYPSLVETFELLKGAKAAGDFGDVSSWAERLQDRAKAHFHWPTEKEQLEWAAMRANHPIIITQPEDALGQRWDFGSFLDAIESGEYSLLEIAQTSPNTAELRIDPEAYPYGGIEVFIALVEAHGMHILGVNEYGKYQDRAELTGKSNTTSTDRKRPWWKFWKQ